MRERGKAIGSEFAGKGANVALGPDMNIARVAQGVLIKGVSHTTRADSYFTRAGRNWEGFGADPFLSGEAAYETILGMQQSGVQACAKHWINNEQEYARAESTSQVDDRTEHEIYAPPFLRSVMAGVASVMCSYSEWFVKTGVR